MRAPVLHIRPFYCAPITVDVFDGVVVRPIHSTHPIPLCEIKTFKNSKYFLGGGLAAESGKAIALEGRHSHGPMAWIRRHARFESIESTPSLR